MAQAKAGTVTLDHGTAVKLLSGYITPTGQKASERVYAALATESNFIIDKLSSNSDINTLPNEQRTSLRTDVYIVDETIGKMQKKKLITDPTASETLSGAKKSLDKLTKYIPLWVKVAVLAGPGLRHHDRLEAHRRHRWRKDRQVAPDLRAGRCGRDRRRLHHRHRRLRRLPGEHDPRTFLRHRRGTMAANRSGLQKETLINILLAWVLTLPVCVFLGATLFAASLFVLFHIFGVK